MYIKINTVLYIIVCAKTICKDKNKLFNLSLDLTFRLFDRKILRC